MKKINFIAIIFIIILFSSCAKRIVVNYNTNSQKTGTIELLPNRSIPKSYVTINDSLIVKGEFVKNIVINNVPIGVQKVHYSADSRWYKIGMDSSFEVVVKKDKRNTILVAVPPYSTGFWISEAIYFVVLYAIWFVILY